MQRALGVVWDTKADTFSPSIITETRPFTKRGILATVNTLGYDPAGLISPVTLLGKLFQREMLPQKKSGSELVSYGWDDPLPELHLPRWVSILDSLKQLNEIKVARSFYPASFFPVYQELHVFCDASEDAIGYVMYLRSVSSNGKVHVAFVTSGSRVAPRSATSIPRLELCAAAEAIKAALSVLSELECKPYKSFYHSDSMVVLGYLANCERRFTKYVARRVHMTLSHTSIADWSYVNTQDNPADFASRPTSPEVLMQSFWFSGPAFLWSSDFHPIPYDSSTVQDILPEERPLTPSVVTLVTSVGTPVDPPSRLASLFERVSDFNKLIRVVLIMQKWKCVIKSSPKATPTRDSAVKCLVRAAQLTCYQPIINSLCQGKELPKCNSLAQFSPLIDAEGILRVGGRLARAQVPFDQKHPILIPAHPLAHSLVCHLHREAKHRGGHITSAVVRQAGYYIVKGSSIIRHLISQFYFWRKFREKLASKMMILVRSVELSLLPRSGADARCTAIRGKHSLVLLASASDSAVDRSSETPH